MNQYKSRSSLLAFLSAVAGFISVAGITVKDVCQGHSVQAFQKIEFNCDAIVHLIRNDDGNANIEIAVWSIQNCIRNESILPEYQGRLLFDQNGTIMIQNFDYRDQANYVALSKMGPLPKLYEVQLSLMVAPDKTCKPVIEQLGNSLNASLKANDCGKPLAVPYWKDYVNVSNTTEPILKLNPEMEAREYTACIKGASLACVNNVTLSDYCTTFKTQGTKSPPASSETIKTYALIAVCITLGILLFLTMLLLAVLFIRYRRMKLLVQSQNSKVVESCVLWREQSDNLKLQKDNPRSKLKTQCDLENDREELKAELQSYTYLCKIEEDVLLGDATLSIDREEVTTEEQSCSDLEKLRELNKLRDEIRCKICTINRMGVCFYPCKHIVTCTKCSSSLQKCPLCRIVIEQKLAVNFD